MFVIKKGNLFMCKDGWVDIESIESALFFKYYLEAAEKCTKILQGEVIQGETLCFLIVNHYKLVNNSDLISELHQKIIDLEKQNKDLASSQSCIKDAEENKASAFSESPLAKFMARVMQSFKW